MDRGTLWRLWISSRNDGLIDFFFSGQPKTSVPVDAVVTPGSVTWQPTFTRATVDPAVIERFLREADTALGPGGPLSDAEYTRWSDSASKLRISLTPPSVRFNIGNPADTGTRYGGYPGTPLGLWMSWTPSFPRRRVNIGYQFRIGTGCFGAGPAPDRGFLSALTAPQNDSLMSMLRRAVANARRLRAEPSMPTEKAVYRRDEVTCVARPVSSNRVPSYPPRDSVGYAMAADVRVALVIDSSGRVTRATPSVRQPRGVDSLTRFFSAEAAATLKYWRFTPARLSNGRAVSQALDVFVRFLPPGPRDVSLSLLDSTMLSPAIVDARADTADLLVVANRMPRSDFGMARRVVTGDGVALHVEEGGPHCGLPVVIVNYPGASIDRWRQVIEQLAYARWTVQYDLRGEGQSGVSPRADYSVEAQVNDLAAVIDSLKLPPLMLVSQAEGWKIAVAYAARNQGRVAGVVAFAASDQHGMAPQTKADWLEQLKAVSRGKSGMVPGGFNPGPMYSDIAELIVSDLRRADSTALIQSVDKLFSYDVGPAMLSYTGPLISVGPSSAMFPPTTVSTMKFIPGPGSYSTLLEPATVARIIEEQRRALIGRTTNRECPQS
jgi:pimeloyl-ACP methyl ester carboxylesterase